MLDLMASATLFPLLESRHFYLNYFCREFPNVSKGQKASRIKGKFGINHLLQILCLVNDEPE